MDKKIHFSLLVMVLLITKSIFGCTLFQINSYGSRHGGGTDDSTGNMTGVWLVSSVNKMGLFSSKITLNQRGHRLKGLIYFPSGRTFCISGSIREDRFILKAEVPYGPSDGFMIEFTGHVDGAQAAGKTYYGPRWVPWNLNWVSKNYDKILRGKFTAQRQSRQGPGKE